MLKNGKSGNKDFITLLGGYSNEMTTDVEKRELVHNIIWCNTIQITQFSDKSILQICKK